MKYRKKPIIVDAIQCDGKSYDEIAEWILATDSLSVLAIHKRKGFIEIETLQESRKAYPKDWIIHGFRGEIYPCKPDIFEATYEPVEEGQ